MCSKVKCASYGVWALFLTAWLCPLPALAGTPVYPAVSVAALPHDSNAFTQGFFFKDGFFYESTGLYGQSSLRRVDPATGRVLARRALSAKFFGEGLTLVGDKLYQLTWREGRVFVYDFGDFRSVGEFPLSTEGWGVCTFDGQLVVSDGSDKLYFYNPTDMKNQGVVSVTDDGVPVERLNELETVGGTIWANVWGETRIAVIDPASGRVLAWVDCTALASDVTSANPDNVLNGIAFDAATGRVWVTGKLWPKVYEIKVPGLPLGTSR
jgi:glutaminyl-peptide cyclotransferase